MHLSGNSNSFENLRAAAAQFCFVCSALRSRQPSGAAFGWRSGWATRKGHGRQLGDPLASHGLTVKPNAKLVTNKKNRKTTLGLYRMLLTFGGPARDGTEHVGCKASVHLTAAYCMRAKGCFLAAGGDGRNTWAKPLSPHRRLLPGKDGYLFRSSDFSSSPAGLRPRTRRATSTGAWT